MRKLLLGICPANRPSTSDSSRMSCMSSLTRSTSLSDQDVLWHAVRRVDHRASLRGMSSSASRPAGADTAAALGVEEAQRARPHGHLCVLALAHARVDAEPSHERGAADTPLVVE